MPKNDVKCASFTVISIDSMLAYANKFYFQVYLDYIHDVFFYSNENYFFDFEKCVL